MNEILKIGCPVCGNVIRVSNIPNIQSKLYTCNVCGEKSRISDSKHLGYEDDPKAQRNNTPSQPNHSQVQSLNPGQKPYAQPDEVVKVKCSCGLVVSFKYKQGSEHKMITCPNCHTKSRVSDLQRVLDKPRSAQQPQGTHFTNQTTKGSAGKNHDDEHTRYASDDEENTRLPSDYDPTRVTEFTTPKRRTSSQNAVLRVKGSSQSFQLAPGKNVIGKKAGSSTAGIQIDTETRRLSREHLVITAMDTPEEVAYYVSLYKERVNPTFVGNTLLEYGDEIRLQSGTEIRLPDVTVIFDIIDNDRTEFD